MIEVARVLVAELASFIDRHAADGITHCGLLVFHIAHFGSPLRAGSIPASMWQLQRLEGQDQSKKLLRSLDPPVAGGLIWGQGQWRTA